MCRASPLDRRWFAPIDRCAARRVGLRHAQPWVGRNASGACHGWALVCAPTRKDTWQADQQGLQVYSASQIWKRWFCKLRTLQLESRQRRAGQSSGGWRKNYFIYRDDRHVLICKYLHSFPLVNWYLVFKVYLNNSMQQLKKGIWCFFFLNVYLLLFFSIAHVVKNLNTFSSFVLNEICF